MKMRKDHKQDQSLGSQTPNQEEIIDSVLQIDLPSPKFEGGDTEEPTDQEEFIDIVLPIDISSHQLEGGEKEESTIFDNMDVKDLTQNPSHSSHEKEDSGELLMKMEKQHTGD